VSGKTGSHGRPWVLLNRPKPPAVTDPYTYWGDQPPERSARCVWWLEQIDRGWRPNRALRMEACESSAHWYGIYLWEYINVIAHRLAVYATFERGLEQGQVSVVFVGGPKDGITMVLRTPAPLVVSLPAVNAEVEVEIVQYLRGPSLTPNDHGHVPYHFIPPNPNRKDQS